MHYQEQDTASGFSEPTAREIREAIENELDAFGRDPFKSTVGERLMNGDPDDLITMAAAFFAPRMTDERAVELLTTRVRQVARQAVEDYTAISWECIRRDARL